VNLFRDYFLVYQHKKKIYIFWTVKMKKNNWTKLKNNIWSLKMQKWQNLKKIINFSILYNLFFFNNIFSITYFEYNYYQLSNNKIILTVLNIIMFLGWIHDKMFRTVFSLCFLCYDYLITKTYLWFIDISCRAKIFSAMVFSIHFCRTQQMIKLVFTNWWNILLFENIIYLEIILVKIIYNYYVYASCTCLEIKLV